MFGFKKKIIETPKEIVLFRTTYDVYHILYSDTISYEDYETDMQPYNLQAFISNHLSILSQNVPLEGVKIKVVTLDEEYLKWLSDNEKSANVATQLEYANSLSDEELFRLMKKNKMHISNFNMGIQVVTTPQESYERMQLDEKLCKQMADYLHLLYPDFKVYCPGYVVPLPKLLKERNRLNNMATAFFEDNVKVKLGMWSEAPVAEDLIKFKEHTCFGIPFCLHDEVDTAVFHISINDVDRNIFIPVNEQIYTKFAYIDCLCYNEDSFKQYKLTDIPLFYETEIARTIEKQFNFHCEFNDFPFVDFPILLN